MSANKISAARTAAGLTQAELAQHLVDAGVYTSVESARPLISRYESGDREPGLRAALAMATACGVTVDELVGRLPRSGLMEK